MIEAHDLSLKYTASPEYTLRGLSIAVESQGVTVVLGRSGVGKSTLIALIAGMFGRADQIVEVFQGSVSIDGANPDSMRGPGMISWVPQSPLLLDHLSVLNNILLPTTIDQTSDTEDARALAFDLMKDVGLAGKEKCYPKELSGGMLTRVSLLRALITRPKYLFLDEPFNGLDLVTRFDIYRLIARVRRDTGLSTILTTHDIPEAAILADRIVLLREGQDRTTAEVFCNVHGTLHDHEQTLGSARLAAIGIEKRLFAGEAV